MSGFDLLPHFENPYPVKEQHTKSSPPAKSSATTPTAPTTVPFDEDDDGSEDAPKEWIVPGGNHVTIEVFHWNPSCEAAECCGLGWMP